MALDLSIPVLVVGDHDAAIQTVRALQQLGFVKADLANNVAEALSKMRVKRYELIISDCATSEPSSGCDFLAEVRGDPDLNRPLFIVTGKLSVRMSSRQKRLARTVTSLGLLVCQHSRRRSKPCWQRGPRRYRHGTDTTNLKIRS